MSDRQKILDIITTGYAARMRGDLDGVMHAFSESAHFRLNTAPVEPALPPRTAGGLALRVQMGEFINQFEFSNMEILNCVIEGQKAAVHSRMTVKAKSTGNMIQTELFDLIELKNGKIVSFTQFFDTASAMALLQTPTQVSATLSA